MRNGDRDDGGDDQAIVPSCVKNLRLHVVVLRDASMTITMAEYNCLFC